MITPRADAGQGVYSVQAALISEELDIDPDKVTLSPGLPDPAYYNAEILQEASPLPAYDESWIAERIRGFLRVAAKFTGMQRTGGSSTVLEAYEKLRVAGAVARNPQGSGGEKIRTR